MPQPILFSQAAGNPDAVETASKFRAMAELVTPHASASGA
jgi:hypothetical protein